MKLTLMLLLLELLLLLLLTVGTTVKTVAKTKEAADGSDIDKKVAQSNKDKKTKATGVKKEKNKKIKTFLTL